uniref:Junctophilin n=1 Tax=Mesocestoides corti TaxID=53468 RepID=A0A5K3FMY7_MESCO
MSNTVFAVPQIVAPATASLSTTTTTKQATDGQHANSKDQTPIKPVCLPAGRYEFRDNGIYIGEWLDEKAVGLGLITKDKSQGEYTGLWEAGSEKSGVFLWPNAPGAMYEGEWAMNRRNGFGVFNREDWVIMGKFEDDFITMGVKGKENAPGKFEGRFENGFPAFGVETYGDKGTYCGEYKNGIREGLGVRRSITYREVLELYPEIKKASNSSKLEDLRKRGKLPSAVTTRRDRRMSLDGGSIDVPCDAVGDANNSSEGEGVEDGANDPEPYTAPRDTANSLTSPHRHQSATYRLMVTQRCGFMLSSKRSDLFIKRLNKLKHPRLNPLGCTTPVLAGRKRTQSLSMLFTYPEETFQSPPSGCVRQMRDIYHSSNSLPHRSATPQKVVPAEKDTLELDLIADDTVEVYSGEWFSDARHGFGVCERTDGLVYYGQWFKNLRHGYGHTCFPDGTFEQGRYRNGKLVYLALPAGNKPHMVLYNRHIMQEVQKTVQKAMLVAEQAQKKAIEAREQVSIKILDYIEKAKAAASCARDYSLEARELVREMYPDFEQPGIKYLEDIVRMMRVTRQGSPTFEAALQSAKDVIAGIVRGLTRNGDEDTEEEEQPEEDLTLPPKFTSQLKELQEKKLAASRAGSVRAQRRARAQKMAEELRRRERLLMGEDPKVVMDSAVEAQRQQQLKADKQQLKSKSQQQQHQLDQEKKKAAAAATSSGDRAAATDLRADRWAAEMMPTKRQQNGPLNASGRATTPTGGYLHVPGGKRRGRRRSVVADDEVDGSYVEIPDMTELKHQYEIPACPLTKLLANPTLFSNHFDYYTTLPPPITARATATTGLHQAKLTRPEVLVQPEKLKSVVVEKASPEISPSSSDSFGFLSKLAFWSWGKSEEPSKEKPSVTPTPMENGFPVNSPAITSFSQLVPDYQDTSESQLMAAGLIDRRHPHTPSTESSQSILQVSDIFEWIRSNISLLAIICLNIILLRIFFTHLGQTDDEGGQLGS